MHPSPEFSNLFIHTHPSRLSERGGDPEQLTYWDEQVAMTGAFLIQTRIQAIQELEQLAALVHLDLTRTQEVLRLNYRPSYDPIPTTPGQLMLPIDTPVDRSNFTTEQIAQGFQQALIEKRPEEIARGQTTIGPHRDELCFMANSVDMGTYGSRGQVRTTMLSLKIAEISWMKAKTGHWPVLLLDEVLAELDPYRRLDLLTRLAKSEQTLLTTTDLDLFTPEFTKQATLWKVGGQRVQVG